jgi:hypothetical protein
MREQLGRRTLAADAIYCAVGGALAIGLRHRLARRLALPPALLGAVGAATVAWAAVVGRSRHRDLRPTLRAVGAANTLAAAGLLVTGWRRRHRPGAGLLVATGLEVAAFAGSQALALTRPERAAA